LENTLKNGKFLNFTIIENTKNSKFLNFTIMENIKKLLVFKHHNDGKHFEK
jgi:hypothetical protein